MKIYSEKIPVKMKALPDLYHFINKHGQGFTIELADILLRIPKLADQSNASWKEISEAISSYSSQEVHFDFYTSKNIFVGHNVISHATNGYVINYNTRFHSVGSMILPDWIENFYHELTHCADQRSPLSFSHKSQKDKGTAPFIVGDMARQLYLSKEWK